MAQAAAGGGAPLPRLTQLEGTRLYRRNVFATTGVRVYAGGRAVHTKRQYAKTRLAVMSEWPPDSRAPFDAPYRAEEVLAAFDGFQNPRDRIVDELLWLWEDDGADCGCPAEVHREHDEAVLAHARAIADEGDRKRPAAELERLWIDAAEKWARVLPMEAIWEHLRRRAHSLDDPRLGPADVESLRRGVPELLVSPIVELATSRPDTRHLLSASDAWDALRPAGRVVGRAYERALEPEFRIVNEKLEAAERFHSSHHYRKAADLLLDEAVPALRRLRQYVPQISRMRYQNAANAVARRLNLAQVQIADEDAADLGAQRYAISLLETALEFVDGGDREQIERNLETLKDRLAPSGRTAPASTYGGRPRSPSDDPEFQAAAKGCLLSWLWLLTYTGAFLTLAFTIWPDLRAWYGWCILAGFLLMQGREALKRYRVLMRESQALTRRSRW
ncbi:hypothetical protein OHR68_41755 [Spirillospora sp. NBC_00431]